MKPIVNYQNKNLYLVIGEYPNGRIGILLSDKNGELWDDLTINLPNKEIEDDCVFVNPTIQNDLLDKLCETEVFFNLYRIEDYDYRVIMFNKNALKSYINEYSIKICEMNEDRNQGFSISYDKHFSNFYDALNVARNLYDDNDLASIMITNHNKSLYCRDKETFETFYINGDSFSKVPQSIFDEYIGNWLEHKELSIKENKLYSQQIGGGYIAVDNSTNECYVEEFDTEEQAQKWLLGKEKEEILEEGVLL